MLVVIDFETTSELDLKKTGACKYARHPSTKVLCMAYKLVTGAESGSVGLWIPGSPAPDFVKHPELTLIGWNIAFDALIWHHVAGFQPTKLLDVMAMSCYAGYPASLDEAARVLLNDNKQKINFRKCTQEQLFEYCKHDVWLTYQLFGFLKQFWPDTEQRIWEQTQQINLHGIPVDQQELEAAVSAIEYFKTRLNSEIPELTNGAVNSATQVKALTDWISEQLKKPIKSLDKKSITKLLNKSRLPKSVRRVLYIRQQVGLSTNAKYKKALDYSLNDHIYDSHFYYGAYTGRYAGRGVQFQNLKRSKTPKADTFFKLVLQGPKVLEFLYDEPLKVFSDMVRAIIKAPKGKKFSCADFSSIEAVTVPWLCQERQLLADISKGLDQYKLQAASMFHVEYDKVTDEQRQAGKLAVLACGYGGGYRALKGMSENYNLDMPNKQAREYVSLFRKARPLLVRMWERFFETALFALRYPDRFITVSTIPVSFRYDSRHHILNMKLPSGRLLFYHRPRIVSENSLRCMIRNRVLTFTGAKLFQNCVQAVCRDILFQAQLRLEKAGYPIILSVHDEVLCEVPDDPAYTLEEMIKIMCEVPDWAKGLPVNADGWEGKRYRK